MTTVINPNLAPPVVCGSVYKRHTSFLNPEAVLLEGLNPNSADNLWEGFEYDTRSDGCFGEWVTFSLEDGNTILLQGPWQINHTIFTAHTRVDLSEKSLSYLYLAENPGTSHGRDMKDVEGIVYCDEAPVIGRDDRYLKLAEYWTRKTQKDLWFVMWRPHSKVSGLIRLEKSC